MKVYIVKRLDPHATDSWSDIRGVYSNLDLAEKAVENEWRDEVEWGLVEQDDEYSMDDYFDVGEFEVDQD